MTGFSIFPYCSVRTALYITALGTRQVKVTGYTVVEITDFVGMSQCKNSIPLVRSPFRFSCGNLEPNVLGREPATVGQQAAAVTLINIKLYCDQPVKD